MSNTCKLIGFHNKKQNTSGHLEYSPADYADANLTGPFTLENAEDWFLNSRQTNLNNHQGQNLGWNSPDWGSSGFYGGKGQYVDDDPPSYYRNYEGIIYDFGDGTICASGKPCYAQDGYVDTENFQPNKAFLDDFCSGPGHMSVNSNRSFWQLHRVTYDEIVGVNDNSISSLENGHKYHPIRSDRVSPEYLNDINYQTWAENYVQLPDTQLLSSIPPLFFWRQYFCEKKRYRRCRFNCIQDNGMVQGSNFYCPTGLSCDSGNCYGFNGTYESWREDCEAEGNVSSLESDTEDAYFWVSSNYPLTWSDSNESSLTHPANEPFIGCYDPENYWYDENQEYCFTDVNEIGSGSPTPIYTTFCPQTDCNSTPLSDCEELGCSEEDLCGECICGDYINSNLPIIGCDGEVSCEEIIPPNGAHGICELIGNCESMFDSDGQAIACQNNDSSISTYSCGGFVGANICPEIGTCTPIYEEGTTPNCLDMTEVTYICAEDVNNNNCNEIVIDQCGVCSDSAESIDYPDLVGISNFPSHQWNEDDLGCGCFVNGPREYYIDNDQDCLTAEQDLGEDCYVSSNLKSYCNEHGDPTVESNIACPDFFQTGQRICNEDFFRHWITELGPPEYQPFLWINLNDYPNAEVDDSLDVLGTGTGLCDDINANNYQEGVDCTYDHVIGDLIFRYDYTHYSVLEKKLYNMSAANFEAGISIFNNNGNHIQTIPFSRIDGDGDGTSDELHDYKSYSEFVDNDGNIILVHEYIIPQSLHGIEIGNFINIKPYVKYRLNTSQYDSESNPVYDTDEVIYDRVLKYYISRNIPTYSDSISNIQSWNNINEFQEFKSEFPILDITIGAKEQSINTEEYDYYYSQLNILINNEIDELNDYNAQEGYFVLNESCLPGYSNSNCTSGGNFESTFFMNFPQTILDKRGTKEYCDVGDFGCFSYFKPDFTIETMDGQSTIGMLDLPVSTAGLGHKRKWYFESMKLDDTSIKKSLMSDVWDKLTNTSNEARYVTIYFREHPSEGQNTNKQYMGVYRVREYTEETLVRQEAELQNEIVFSEIQSKNGDWEEQSLEYVELYNRSGSPIDLTGYQFGDTTGQGTADNDRYIFYPSSSGGGSGNVEFRDGGSDFEKPEWIDDFYLSGNLRNYNGELTENVVLPSNSFLVIYQDRKWGTCTNGTGYCHEDIDCNIPAGEGCQCQSDDSNCYGPAFPEEWECEDNCDGATISIGTTKNPTEGQYKTIEEIKQESNGVINVRFDRDEPEDDFGNPFTKGQVVYLDIPNDYVTDGTYGSSQMTGLYYACDMGEWDNSGGTQGISLCCHPDGVMTYQFNDLGYTNACNLLCNTEGDPNGECDDGLQENSFYVENYRLSDPDFVCDGDENYNDYCNSDLVQEGDSCGNGGTCIYDGMGLGGDFDAVLLYRPDGSVVSQVWYADNGINNQNGNPQLDEQNEWGNVNTDHAFALKHPDCFQNHPSSWKTRYDSYLTPGYANFDNDTNDCDLTIPSIDEVPSDISFEIGSTYLPYQDSNCPVGYMGDSNNQPTGTHCMKILSHNLTSDDAAAEEIFTVLNMIGDDTEEQFLNRIDWDSFFNYLIFNEVFLSGYGTHFMNILIQNRKIYFKFNDWWLIDGMNTIPKWNPNEQVTPYCESISNRISNVQLYYDAFDFYNQENIFSSLIYTDGVGGSQRRNDCTIGGGGIYDEDGIHVCRSLWNKLVESIVYKWYNLFEQSLNCLQGGEYSEQSFGNELLQTYNKFRELFTDEYIDEKVNYYSDYLSNEILLDETKYKYSTQVKNNYKEFTENLKNIINSRINWLDKNIKTFVSRSVLRELEDHSNQFVCDWQNPYECEYCYSCSQLDMCNDKLALNYNALSNFNDGSCRYVSDRKTTIQVDTSYVNFPPITQVNFVVNQINGKSSNLVYEMQKLRENLYQFELPTNFLPGTKLNFSFQKITPDVYNVDTGREESDQPKEILISFDLNQSYTYYFNEFVDTLVDSNLPIIKIDTKNYNDFGFINDNNPLINKPWYCPGFADPITGLINDSESEEQQLFEEGYFEDGYTIYDFCSTLENEIENGDGYFETKEECELSCNIECTDGFNIWDEPKVTGKMDIIYKSENSTVSIDDNPQISTRVGIEVRGYSSRGFAKKQYSIETQLDGTPQCKNMNKDYNLFCSGFNPLYGIDYEYECAFSNENDFVLLGPYRDRTYMRNAFTYRLWEGMNHYASDTKFVEFILNDSYMGLYVMMERIKLDQYRIPVDINIEDDIDGGYMIKVESAGEQNYFVSNDGYTKYEYYDPQPNPFVPSDKPVSDKIQKDVLDLERAAGVNFTPDFDLLSSLLDLESFADYFITQELARNNEGFTRSQYWYNYGNHAPDGFDNNKFYMGPVWDMNHAYAATVEYTEGWALETFFAIPEFWKKIRESDVFQQTVYDRWQLFKSDLLNPNRMVDRISDIALSFTETNAIERDLSRWYQSGRLDYEFDINKMKKYILDRFAWMDSRICNEFVASTDSYFRGRVYGKDDFYSSALTCDFSLDESVVPSSDMQEAADNLCNSINVIGTPCYVLDVLGDSVDPNNYPDITCQPSAPAESHCTEDILPDNGVYITVMDNYPSEYLTFINIYYPYNGKVFSVDETSRINFNFKITPDIISRFEINENDTFVRFIIRDKYTGDLVHTFESSGNSYQWDISRLNRDDLIGDYEVNALFTDRLTSDGTETKTTESNIVNFSILSITLASGCTDTSAVNYDPLAFYDDNSCKYEEDCDYKYLLRGSGKAYSIEEIPIYEGFNSISFPFEFSINDISLWDALTVSFTADGDQFSGGFTEDDIIISFFEGKIYTATYMDNKWVSVSSEGLNMEYIQPGMGIIFKSAKAGKIVWNI